MILGGPYWKIEIVKTIHTRVIQISIIFLRIRTGILVSEDSGSFRNIQGGYKNLVISKVIQYNSGTVIRSFRMRLYFSAVFRICKFLGFPDPDP